MRERGLDGRIIGRILRRKRLEKKAKDNKWTIEYLGAEANLDHKHIQKLETGLKKAPQFITIAKIARALNYSTEELIDEYYEELEKLSPDGSE